MFKFKRNRRNLIVTFLKLLFVALIFLIPNRSHLGGNRVNPGFGRVYAAGRIPKWRFRIQDLKGNPVEGFQPKRIAYPDIPPMVRSVNEATAIGFINYDGIPVEGASVTIAGPTATVTTTTQTGPLSEDPYFTVTLSTPPLNAVPNDVLKMGFSYASQENITAFRVVSGEQELYGYLSSTCGPTEINDPLISTNTIWIPECGPYRVHQNVMVDSTVSLSVTAGTTVEFDPGRALLVDGFIGTDGLTNTLVTFTALNPVPGEWNYIQVNNAAILKGVLLEYAGGANLENNAALRVDSGDATMDNVIVRSSASDGIQVYNDGDVQMNNVIVADNDGWGIVEDSTTFNMDIYNSIVQFNGDGGIWVVNAGVGEIYSNYIADNMGSGIFIDSSNLYFNIAGNIISRNNEFSNGGAIDFEDTRGIIENNLIWDNQAGSRGGGIHVFRTDSTSPTVIENNIILGNSETLSQVGGGGGLYLRPVFGEAQVKNNVIVGNSSVNDGGGIYSLAADNVDVFANSILRNDAVGEGGGIYADYPGYINTSILTNTILENTAGIGQGAIHLTAESDPIHNNNLYNNSDYTLFYGAPFDPDGVQNAHQNWWGTDVLEEISEQIWDWFDDSSLGVVDFEPPLTTTSITAPMTPPQDLVATTEAFTITLGWSPNPEADLAGYKLYFSPEDHLEIDAILGVVTPLDVGLTTGVTITDVPVGIYNIAVTAYDIEADGVKDWREGHESWFSMVETAIVGESPQANFYAVPLTGTVPLTVHFTDTSTGDFDTWLWSFGDGDTSTEQHPIHTYDVTGTFTVSLTVDGPLGSDSETRPGYITVLEDGVVSDAEFTANPTTGEVPLTVQFTDLSTGDIDSWDWTFGDGGTSTEQHPTHTYTVSGTYTVTLTVDGSTGTDTEIKPGYIMVVDPGTLPLADFTASPTSGEVPLTVHFTDLSVGDIDGWTWIFGDGGTSTEQHPTHTYTVSGTYTVTLTVDGATGVDTATKPDYVTVLSSMVNYLPITLK